MMNTGNVTEKKTNTINRLGAKLLCSVALTRQAREREMRIETGPMMRTSTSCTRTRAIR